MKLEYFAIHDAKTGYYMNPWGALSVAAALRSFRDLVNEPGHELGKHPEDYTLFHVATFDQENGRYVPVEPTVALSKALFLKEVAA